MNSWGRCVRNGLTGPADTVGMQLQSLINCTYTYGTKTCVYRSGRRLLEWELPIRPILQASVKLTEGNP